jgi:beta-lactamase regulating signal transducer with metallopeptidase domain
METYLFKFSACLTVFWLIYILFLEREHMHHLKRFYLLGAFVISLTIPLLTITHYIEPVVITDFETIQPLTPLAYSPIETNQVAPPFWNLEKALYLIYAGGALLFAIRFMFNLLGMFRRISKNHQMTKGGFIYVLLEGCRVPHSFFKYLFFNKTNYESNSIPIEVQLHEETHASQWHSLDIVLVELLQIVFWFHPLVYLLKHHIKLNHEFLADEAVLNQGIDAKNYQTILLQFSSNTEKYQLSSAINYSSIKKRFTVMKTQTSKTRIWLSRLLLMPLLAILVYGFSGRAIVEKAIETQVPLENSLSLKNQNSTKKSTARNIDIKILDNDNYLVDDMSATKKTLVKVVNRLHKDITPDIRKKIMNIHVSGSRNISNRDIWFIYDALLDYGFYRIVHEGQEIIRGKGNTPFAMTSGDYPDPTLQKGASKEQMAQYNKLAGYYNTLLSDNKSVRIKLKDVERLTSIYSIMSDKQRKVAAPFPDFPEAPNSPPKPTNPTNPRLIEVAEAPEIFEIEDVIKEQNTTLVEVLEQKDERTITGTRDVKGQTLYYTSKKGTTTYYNRWGQKVDRKGDIIDPEQTHAEDVIAGQVISKIYKDGTIIAEFNSENVSIPPPPPPAPPKIPSIRTLSERGAVFYYEGKEISSEKAIKLTDNTKDLNLLIKAIDTKQPIVKISKQPISADKD